jgi:3,4-dihydroxy 2-butanone 4-phosphate synthase/GTP cyclohydrolase II
MRAIADEGRGVVVLLRDVSPTISLPDETGPHTLRQYGVGAQILSTLGLSELILLTNSVPVKVVGLDGYGLSIHSTRPIPKD